MDRVSGRDPAPSDRRRRFYALALLAFALAVHVTAWRLANTGLEGDEYRYLDQARRFVRGESLYPDGVVENPPLLPVAFGLLLKAGVPLAALKLASVAATAAASLVLFSLLARFWTLPWAFALGCAFTAYPPLVMLGSQLMTEPYAVLALLLACRSLVGIGDVRRPGLARLLVLAALLAALALLKPIFGYAAAAACCLALALGALGAWGLRRFHLWAGAATGLSLLLCAPWLAHMHSLTGSAFSWGTTGGQHLYWMSIGGEDVWGSWVASDKVGDIDFLVDTGIAAEVAAAETMAGPDAQAYYASLGAERIRQEPLHLARNLTANAARVLFNYPFSFRPQSLYTYAYLLPNMVLYLALALCAALWPVHRGAQPPGPSAALVFAAIYLGGNVLVGSTGRQGLVVIGPLLVWIALQVRLMIDAGLVVVPPRR